MARQPSTFNDPGLLEAALEGLNLQKARIEAQIAEIRSRLGGRRGTAKKTAGVAAQGKSQSGGRRRTLSESARKRIAAAQKKRWAEYRKSQAKGDQ